MNYFESELLFKTTAKSSETLSRGIGDLNQQAGEPSQDTLLGIRVLLGNAPLVFRIKDFVVARRSIVEEKSQFLNNEKETYLIVHAISAARIHGKAKVEELQYFAEARNTEEFQTIDVIPQTKFREVFKAGINIYGVLSLSGQASYEIPSDLGLTLTEEFFNIGANMKLQLCNTAGYIGKFTYSIQMPVIQSGGVGSNTCYWILNPDENKTPLLGDQLLIQSISVPKECQQLSYNIYGVVKADKGIFWKQQELRTPTFNLDIKLK